MKASVVLPVYNKAPWLQECLDSVFTQTFTDFEVIAVDDASTDGSLGILEHVNDPRLRIIRLEKNIGPGGAAQRGIDAATGEYIIRVDADDIMVPDRFAKQIALLDADPTIGACSSPIRLMTDPNVLHGVPLDDVDCKAGMLFGVPLNQPASAYRRSVLVENNIRYADEWPRYGEDRMYMVPLSKVTRFKNVDESLIHYRKGSMNIAHGRDRNADLRFLTRYVFGQFGFPITDEELEVHLYTVRFFAHPPTAQHIKRYRAWLDRLTVLNRERGTFDGTAFQRRLDRMWEEVFFNLPHYGMGPTLAHIRSSGSVSGGKLYYLFASFLKGGKHSTIA